jgi:hypothetical protein
VLGEQLVSGVQQLGECARSQQQVAARVESVAQMMAYIASRAPLDSAAQQGGGAQATSSPGVAA